MFAYFDLLINLIMFNLSKIFNLNEIDIVYQASSLTFDPSLIEIFSSLYSKSTLLILPQLFKLMTRKLASILKNYKITFIQVTNSLLDITWSKSFNSLFFFLAFRPHQLYLGIYSKLRKIFHHLFEI